MLLRSSVLALCGCVGACAPSLCTHTLNPTGGWRVEDLAPPLLCAASDGAIAGGNVGYCQGEWGIGFRV